MQTFLFAANSHPVAINAYADLKRRLRGVIIVPVLNEEILKGKKLREEFPFAHAAAIPVQIPTLAPMLKAQIEKSLYSFSDVHGKLPIGIPIGLAFELRSWTWRTFIEFRELERETARFASGSWAAPAYVARSQTMASIGERIYAYLPSTILGYVRADACMVRAPAP